MKSLLLKIAGFAAIGTFIFFTIVAYAPSAIADDGGLAPIVNPGMGVGGPNGGDGRICIAAKRIFELVEGNLGALVMVCAGIVAVISAAFGAYRAATSLLVVAVGAFIIRSAVDIFFNYTPSVANCLDLLIIP